MRDQPQELTFRRILAFWSPLAATWLMMSMEGPFLAAVIARLPDPKYNLAAFGVSLAFALVLEAPVIMLMGAATALVRDRESFVKMRSFAYAVSAAVTVLLLVLLWPALFRWVTRDLMGLTHDVAQRTYVSVVLFLPWPCAIGYRRFYQGVLIRSNLTRRVGYGTAVRLAAMASVALALFRFDVQGAYVGAAALSGGVLTEAVASRLMVRHAVRTLLASGNTGPPVRNLTYPAIAKFYYPLALSSVLMLVAHPAITFFLAHGRSPLESLAAMPVIRSLVFVFSCLGLSYQEVGIALIGEHGEGYTAVRRFAAGLAVLTVAGLSIIVFSPLANVWFRSLSGLSAELAQFALAPSRILAVVPGLTVFLSFQRSLYVHERRTGPVTWATVLELVTLCVVLWVLIRYGNAVGATAAAVALVSGRVGGNLWLLVSRLRAASPAPATT